MSNATDAYETAYSREGRRGSWTSKFENLENQKRDTSSPGSEERRASITEQRVGKPGYIEQMWNSLTRGTTHPPASRDPDASRNTAIEPGPKQHITRTGAGTLG
ncbi:hypothetical protein EJ06DRAFT_530062 [Trichodelitschia bisporula]|uniref:Uncharacterized protein n=1 Tax=Trichodelitschia bisporula TaxID=703511 RepID=A0A6G1HY78_9PEZI|nr:hypothetical protein EJ06DRAFT_530062 [Trichodelitschia bisporula]